MPSERIERQDAPHERAEAVVAAPQINRIGREEDLARGERQHAARTAATRAATYCSSVPTGTRNVRRCAFELNRDRLRRGNRLLAARDDWQQLRFRSRRLPPDLPPPPLERARAHR